MKMLVNRTTGLIREPLSRPVRGGKTRKDHANGNPSRNIERKLARVAWQQDKSKGNDSFPV
jgi:hypothetical protein